MKINIIPIGNSFGIRIPGMLMKKCGFGKSVNVEIKNNKLILEAADNPREGWTEAFEHAKKQKVGGAIDWSFKGNNAWDEEEWEWK